MTLCTKTATKNGYYGTCSFLDTQSDFETAFGLSPILIIENPNMSNYASCLKILRNYSENCKLDTFLHICRLNYVGHDKIDVTIHTCEVCQKISSLTQTYTLGQRLKVNIPEKLFHKFMQLSVSLPDDATTWPIQLCSTSFFLLHKVLVKA